MDIVINGKRNDVPEGTTLQGFVSLKGLNPETVIIEHNETIAGKESWSAVPLRPGDRLEIVSFVGGG